MCPLNDLFCCYIISYSMESEKIHMTSKISYLETLIGEMKQGQEAETARLKSKNLDSILSNVAANIQRMCQAEVAPLQSANPDLAAYVTDFSNRLLSLVQNIAAAEKKEVVRVIARGELLDEIIKKAEADLQAELAQAQGPGRDFVGYTLEGDDVARAELGQEEEIEDTSDLEKPGDAEELDEKSEQNRQPRVRPDSLKTKRNSSKKS